MSHKEYLKSVGMEIRVARVRQGLTRAELVRRTGLNPNVITWVETGQTDAHILTYRRIIDALGMQMKDFL